MNFNDERASRNRPPVPSAEEAARRWQEGVEKAGWANGPPTPEAARRHEEASRAGTRRWWEDVLSPVLIELRRMSGNLDHIHDDVAALRELMNIPRPECYPDTARKKGARRARRRAGAEWPPPTIPQDGRSQPEP